MSQPAAGTPGSTDAGQPGTPPAPTTAQPAPVIDTSTTPAAPAAPAADVLAQLRADLDAANAKATEWQTFARKHETRAREQTDALAEQQRVMSVLAEKLGVDIGTAPDPAKLAAQVEQARADQVAAQRDLAVFQSAQGLADARALLDSRSFMAQVGALDPNAATFATDVKALIERQVAADPRLAPAAPVTPTAPAPVATPGQPVGVPATSGAPVMAPQTVGDQWTIERVRVASPEEVNQAMLDGKLRNLGFGVPRGARHGR